MFTAISRIPPGVRSRVVHIMVVSGSRPDGSIIKAGGSNNDRFLIQGPIDDAAFAHESFHSVDQGFSGSATFTTAVNADTCVPDDYSNASPAEDFAQLGVWVDYDTNGEKISDYITKSQACMSNQIAAVRNYASTQINRATSVCFARRPNDGNVTASAAEEKVDLEVGPPIVWEFEDVWE